MKKKYVWKRAAALGNMWNIREKQKQKFLRQIHISFFYKGLECVLRRSTKEEQPTDVWSAKWIYNSQQMYDQLNEYTTANRYMISLKNLQQPTDAW